MTLKYIWRSFSLGRHFHVYFSYPWHAFATHGLPAIAEFLVSLVFVFAGWAHSILLNPLVGHLSLLDVFYIRFLVAVICTSICCSLRHGYWLLARRLSVSAGTYIENSWLVVLILVKIYEFNQFFKNLLLMMLLHLSWSKNHDPCDPSHSWPWPMTHGHYTYAWD